ncbi:MarR family winged helix-turn-helix transcriptional regulator [Paraburkholderia youngii]|uniref:MarR family winged helix-turn-helix transcriptional regulator n=1 Tax=Paraburkholderia youngii TaxID=2782701 RepID=UPI003D1D5906
MSSSEPHEKILVYRIRSLDKFITRIAVEMAKDKLQLPLPEVQIITALGALGPTGVMEASRYAEQDKSQTSRVIESLIAKGLAKKKDKPSRIDGRITQISLTAKGSAVLKKIPRVESILEAGVFHALSDKERAQFSGFVDKILNSHRWSKATDQE